MIPDDSTNAFVAIIFADVCSLGKVEKLEGEAAAYDRLQDCRRILKDCLEAASCHPLREVNANLLAYGLTADAALSAAVEMRAAVAATPFDVRIAVNCGWVIPFQGDIYGDAVNLAARVKGLAGPNEIVITEETYNRLSAPLRARMRLFDMATVKGKSESLTFYHYVDGGEDDTFPLLDAGIAPGSSLELDHAGRTYRIETGTMDFTIGRGADNHLVWDFPSVSRYHAVIRSRHGKFFYLDTSANGSSVRYDGGAAFCLVRDKAVLFGSGEIFVIDVYNDRLRTVINYRCC